MLARDEIADKVARILRASGAGETGGVSFTATLQSLERHVPVGTYSIAGLPQPGRGIGTGTVLASSWPEGLLYDYLKFRWFEADPLVAMMRQAPGLFPDQALAEVPTEAVAARRLEAVKDGAGRHFVGVPIRHFGRRIGAVVLSRHEAFSPEESSLIELVAPALHAAAAGLPTALQPSPLTARERECLAWCSEGLTARQIADLLAIRESTAVAHLNAAMRKLGAGSRPQAVAEAIRHGFIS
jgi:LuxR family quorum sensing-dependent transcriptional regulator